MLKYIYIIIYIYQNTLKTLPTVCGPMEVASGTVLSTAPLGLAAHLRRQCLLYKPKTEGVQVKSSGEKLQRSNRIQHNRTV